MTEPGNPNRNNLDAAEGILNSFRLVITAAGVLLPICLVVASIVYLVVRP